MEIWRHCHDQLSNGVNEEKNKDPQVARIIIINELIVRWMLYQNTHDDIKHTLEPAHHKQRDVWGVARALK